MKGKADGIHFKHNDSTCTAFRFLAVFLLILAGCLKQNDTCEMHKYLLHKYSKLNNKKAFFGLKNISIISLDHLTVTVIIHMTCSSTTTV